MSDRNNNDWYDPKAYRSDRVGPYLPPVPTGRGFLANFLIWILIGGAGFWHFPMLAAVRYGLRSAPRGRA